MFTWPRRHWRVPTCLSFLYNVSALWRRSSDPPSGPWAKASETRARSRKDRKFTGPVQVLWVPRAAAAAAAATCLLINQTDVFFGVLTRGWITRKYIRVFPVNDGGEKPARIKPRCIKCLHLCVCILKNIVSTETKITKKNNIRHAGLRRHIGEQSRYFNRRSSERDV